MSATVRARLGTLAGAAIIAVLLWQMGTGAFLDGLRRIDGLTLLAALGIGLLTTVFSAWRWCVVARALRIRLPLPQAVADYYRSQFLNAALPGGVLGDVHRAVRHGRTEGDVGRGVRAVVLERTAGQVVLVMAGVALLFAQPAFAFAQARRLVHAVATTPGAAAALLAVCALGAVAVVRLRRRPGTSRGRRALRAALTEARLGLLARASWPGVVISSVVVLAGYLGMFLLAARAAGSTAPAFQLVPIMVLALLAMALPLNVGGWGPREGVTAWAFGSAGLGAAQGLTVAVVYGVLTFAASLPGVAVLVGQWAIRLRRPQVELEEGVLAEDGPAGRGPQCVAHDRGAVEAQPGDAVAEQDRCHGDVQPVQRTVVQKARHRDAAALDQHPAEPARRKRLHQALRRERGAVRQGQHVNAVRRRPPVAGVRPHHPQGRR
jgi:uncharacterized membrane protein YbhN (UPF0104 family)